MAARMTPVEAIATAWPVAGSSKEGGAGEGGRGVLGRCDQPTVAGDQSRLTFFMIVHCTGNLLIFAGEKGDRFNAYGYFLRSCPLILFIEGYLALGTVVHVLSASWITIRDRKYQALAAPHKPNAWLKLRMSLTGTLILAFFVVH